MSARIALCLDEATRRYPSTMGLGDESMDAQSWLAVYESGTEARRAIGEDDSIGEAWVVASGDVAPINLAATLKADRPELRVRLVTSEGDGSLYSRAHTALIDEVIDFTRFQRLYAEAKQGHSSLQPDDGAPREEPVLARIEPLVAAVKPGRAFLMPVVSGSGGSGKSSVAVAGAFIAREMGYRTLLLDYDLQFGDACVMAGIEDAPTIDSVIARPELLEREIRRDSGLAVVAAPARLESAEDVVHAMPRFLDEMTGAFDVVIANTGAAWADQHVVLLERCSAALFLIDQRASSVRACRHALELCVRCGIASGPFQFAVNRCAKGAPLTSVDVSCALQGAPVFELKDGGRDVEDYLGGGAALELLSSRNDFCASLRHVMESLLPGSAQRVAAAAEPPEASRAIGRRGRHANRRRKRGAS